VRTARPTGCNPSAPHPASPCQANNTPNAISLHRNVLEKTAAAFTGS